MGRDMDTLVGNDTYQAYVRRLPLTMPALDRAALDRAIADVGATPETVTEAQMLRALRATVFPLLAKDGGNTAAAITQAGLITTDATNRVRTITSAAATLLGLSPDADVVGQPINGSPALDRCVPPVDAFADAETVAIRRMGAPCENRGSDPQGLTPFLPRSSPSLHSGETRNLSGRATDCR